MSFESSDLTKSEDPRCRYSINKNFARPEKFREVIFSRVKICSCKFLNLDFHKKETKAVLAICKENNVVSSFFLSTV